MIISKYKIIVNNANNETNKFNLLNKYKKNRTQIMNKFNDLLNINNERQWTGNFKRNNESHGEIIIK